MKGILLINKAKDMTSHDVVAILRGKLKIRRIGHTGTLDPMAEGVLPICIGNATRISEFIMEQGKVYVAKMKFGFSTTTYDYTGEIMNTTDEVDFPVEKIERALDNFRGEIFQKPPMYSAVKINGKKMYEIARSGGFVDIPLRKVEIYEIRILEKRYDELTLYIHCSKGTYIRSLVNDLALSMGSFGYMTELVRTNVGKFRLEDTLDIFDVKDMEVEKIISKIIPAEKCLYNLDSVIVSKENRERLIFGQKINLNKVNHKIIYSDNKTDTMGMNLIKVFTENEFLGIGSLNNKIIKMERVLI